MVCKNCGQPLLESNYGWHFAPGLSFLSVAKAGELPHFARLGHPLTEGFLHDKQQADNAGTGGNQVTPLIRKNQRINPQEKK